MEFATLAQSVLYVIGRSTTVDEWNGGDGEQQRNDTR
jgi:hypothetical protein